MALLNSHGKEIEACHAGYFAYCLINFAKGEVNEYENTGDGHFHQWAYIIDGYGESVLIDKETGEEEHFNYKDLWGDEKGVLFDMSISKNKIARTLTPDVDMNILCFNPIPQDSELHVEVLKGPLNKTITAEDKTITLVSITGSVITNEKEIQNLKFARIFSGKSANITLDETGAVALVTQK